VIKQENTGQLADLISCGKLR